MKKIKCRVDKNNVSTIIPQHTAMQSGNEETHLLTVGINNRGELSQFVNFKDNSVTQAHNLNGTLYQLLEDVHIICALKATKTWGSWRDVNFKFFLPTTVLDEHTLGCTQVPNAHSMADDRLTSQLLELCSR